MYTYACKVVRVVDGDTIDLDVDLGFHIHQRIRVRLSGVNAPENYGRLACPEGRAARDWVDMWIGERLYRGGFRYISKKYDWRDKYGRSVGILQWINAGGQIEELNTAIVTAGHAEAVEEK